jgi:hypothetical protein
MKDSDLDPFVCLLFCIQIIYFIDTRELCLCRKHYLRYAPLGHEV